MISQQKLMDCMFALILTICSFGAHASEEQGIDRLHFHDGTEVMRFANVSLAEAVVAVNASSARIRLVIPSDDAALNYRFSGYLRSDEAAEAIADHLKRKRWKETRRIENGVTVITLEPPQSAEKPRIIYDPQARIDFLDDKDRAHP